MSNCICKNCKYYGNMTANLGLCQRHPPQVFNFYQVPESRWPQVAHDDFCGEFEKKGSPQKVCRNCLKAAKLKWVDHQSQTCSECGHTVLNGEILIDPPKEEPKKNYSIYECPNCSHKQNIDDNYNKDTMWCAECWNTCGFTSWELVS